MLRIAFIIRTDGTTKGGGDVDLAKQYCALIGESSRAATEVVSFADVKLGDFDFAVLFNIDTPFENYLVARECVRLNIPYAIYTLHCKGGHFERYLRYGTMGVQKVVAGALGYSFAAYETVACMVRLAKAGRWRQFLSYRPAAYSARYVLRHATKVLVSCAGEAEYVCRDFAINVDSDVLPHLVDQKGPATPSAPSVRGVEDFVLCAGRIEPRKNQMAVTEVAKACPEMRFLFIGKKNKNHPGYIRAFEAAVAGHENVEWQEQVPLAELRRLISVARAYINLSWFEVFSLIDIMALSARTPSVLSTGSYLYDEISSWGSFSGIEFVEPTQVDEAAVRLKLLPAESVSADNVILNESWSVSGIRNKWADILSGVEANIPHAGHQ